MPLMENVVLVGKIYKVRKRIPPECRAIFGISGEFVTVSLRTREKRVARELAVPILAEIEAKIAQVRGGDITVSPPSKTIAVSRDAAFEAVATWRHQSIQMAHDLAWSGGLKPLGLSSEASRLSRLRYSLSTPHTGDPEGFNERFAMALSSQGIRVQPDHPVLDRQELRTAFRLAWLDIERFTDDFRNDRFNGWPETKEEAEGGVLPGRVPTATALSPKPEGGLSVLELYDRWASVASIKLEARNRGYVQRLAEFLGSKTVNQIEPHDLARFKIEAAKFPAVRSPGVLAMTFNEIVEWAEGPGCDKPKITPITVWKWINTFNGMFAYATKNRWIEFNPAADTMPKPPRNKKARSPLTEQDIAEIFLGPMFTGFEGRSDAGYRERKGPVVVRDAKFWIPIVALYTGARLDEIGSTLASEIRQQDGIWLFDILDRGDEDADSHNRSIKNEQSRRVVPLHAKLIELGFLEYAASVPPSGFLFPDLKPTRTKTGWKRTAKFSKWWGHYRRANAKAAGEGMGSKKKPFHSFRHTTIRALRKPGIHPVLAYLLVGHEDGEIDRMNLGYGEGADLKTLKETVDQIEFPTFPKLPKPAAVRMQKTARPHAY